MYYYLEKKLLKNMSLSFSLYLDYILSVCSYACISIVGKASCGVKGEEMRRIGRSKMEKKGHAILF